MRLRRGELIGLRHYVVAQRRRCALALGQTFWLGYLDEQKLLGSSFSSVSPIDRLKRTRKHSMTRMTVLNRQTSDADLVTERSWLQASLTEGDEGPVWARVVATLVEQDFQTVMRVHSVCFGLWWRPWPHPRASLVSGSVGQLLAPVRHGAVRGHLPQPEAVRSYCLEVVQTGPAEVEDCSPERTNHSNQLGTVAVLLRLTR